MQPARCDTTSSVAYVFVLECCILVGEIRVPPLLSAGSLAAKAKKLQLGGGACRVVVKEES